MFDLAAIEKPTLLLDETRARNNLTRMAAKIRPQGVRFRPHFKTHQSLEMGEWFRAAGVSAITVSSTDMALYFAEAGWDDILIAFTAHPRQVHTLNTLAALIHLELLVESSEIINHLTEHLTHPVDVWIKVDAGNHRTGIPLADHAGLIELARQIRGPRLHFRGLLTHAGQTYHANGAEDIRKTYRQALGELVRAQEAMARAGYPQIELSFGDTPSSTLVDDFSGLDELRPGNFIFYDLMQHRLGVCPQSDIAVAVACPVVAKHAEPGPQGIVHRLVLHGGAVHLSKEFLTVDGSPVYGGLACLDENGWGELLPGAYLYSLSQEHGLAQVSAQQFESIQVGDLAAVVPVHACLTVDLFHEYLTTTGRRIAIKH